MDRAEDIRSTYMIWSSTTPTVPGWYWYRGETKLVLMLYVDAGFVVEQGAWHISEMHGEWAGPIEEPKEGEAT